MTHLIHTTRHQQRAIIARHDLPHPLRMSRKRLHTIPARNLPNPYRLIPTRAHQTLPIRREAYGRHRVIVPVQRFRIVVLVRRVPELDREV